MQNHDDTDQTPLYSEILATEEQVKEKINVLATKLIHEFKGKNPLFVCLLRGGIPFASQLMFAIAKQDSHFHPELDYMTVSRYGEKLTGTTPRIIMDLSHKTTVTDRPVIVVDDMIDGGDTYAFTKKHLENRGARSVYLAALVQREIKNPREFDANFYCFSVASQEWLVGMGLDDVRLGIDANRWMPWIATAHMPGK